MKSVAGLKVVVGIFAHNRGELTLGMVASGEFVPDGWHPARGLTGTASAVPLQHIAPLMREHRGHGMPCPYENAPNHISIPSQWQVG